MFYQVGLLPVTTNLLDNLCDIYLIVYGMIRSDRLIIGARVEPNNDSKVPRN